MRTQSVWAGQDEAPSKPATFSTTTCVFALAVAGVAIWSAAMWAYEVWLIRV